jgi:hypothetical protein
VGKGFPAEREPYTDMVERQPNRLTHVPDQKQNSPEAGQGSCGFPAPATEHIPQQESAAKQSRIPDQKIVFVQHAFASGADDRLDERRRIFLAHAVTKPHLTLQELAPFAGVHTAERARQLWDSGLKALWQASPPELQQQYPLDLLRRHRLAGVPLSAEHRAHTSEAMKGRQHSPETRAKIAAGNRNKGNRLTPEQRAHISEAQTGRQHSPETRAKIAAGNKGKPHGPFTTEHKARISEAIRKRREHRQQQKADLTQREQEQHEATQIFPPLLKT